MKVWLLIALFAAAAPAAARAETIDWPSPVGDQSWVAHHKEFAAVSAPVAVAAVRSAGLDPATLPVKIGSTYVMRAVDRRGTKFRVVLAANTGQILAIHSTATKSKLASSPAATAPALSAARQPPSTPAGLQPVQILPKTATSQHKIDGVTHPASLAAAPPIRVASNEHVAGRIPAALLGTLRSVGLTPATAPVKVEPTYVVQAINQRGMTLRVLLAAHSGDILAIQLTRGATRHERPDGETLGPTEPAPGTRTAPTEPPVLAAHPRPSSEPSFIGP